ncbi:MAG TPA: hypothetical protein PLA26_06795 [Anaerolineaceae bacterium]|nr:hypothetical protein [Anaerolineaceae bacterium]HQK04129.1 hypothetical protein [Anaerolineaceae bacterium]HQL28216.1 hypothetical protein [Anaerolineaceae bacterium]
MFIAQDTPLTPTETRLYILYCQTYPTDLTKFKEYQRLSTRLRFAEHFNREYASASFLMLKALRKIIHSAGKTYHGKLNDLAWCLSLAQSTLNQIENKETK